MCFGVVSFASWRIQTPLASETLGGSTLRSRPASGLGEAGSVYTCHEGVGGWGERGSQSKAPNFSTAPGRKRLARSCGQVEADGQGDPAAAGEVAQLTLARPVPGVARRKPCALGAAAGFPAPSVEQGRAQARSPQARRAGTVPAAPGSAADRCSRPPRGSGRWAGPPHPLPQCVAEGSGAVALTWLVRGGRDGHGSAARGGTGSPGKDRLFRGEAGESGRQTVHSPVSEAAPWAPTRSFSVAAGPPSHYPPPSSAAAAAASTSSSSAENPRPLHTHSHHAAGEPLPPIRHFRAQVARSGPGASGCWGVRGRTRQGN